MIFLNTISHNENNMRNREQDSGFSIIRLGTMRQPITMMMIPIVFGPALKKSKKDRKQVHRQRSTNRR